MISLLVAATENNVIGKDNQLLWHLPNDLRYFKNITWGSVIVMGRKTFESIGKPLPGRINIVISSKNLNIPGIIEAHSINDALHKAAETNCTEYFIVGGGTIYEQLMPQSQKIYMTRVHTHLEGDVRFPEIHESQWMLTGRQEMYKDPKHAYDYSFETWVRK